MINYRLVVSLLYHHPVGEYLRSIPSVNKAYTIIGEGALRGTVCYRGENILEVVCMMGIDSDDTVVEVWSSIIYIRASTELALGCKHKCIHSVLILFLFSFVFYLR